MIQQTDVHVPGYDDIEAELKAFEAAERRRLNLDDDPEHWVDANPQAFTRAQRDSTTILFGGLTVAHDQLVASALGALGYTLRPLDVPDTDALRFGKEFGNRGQCNPTSLTVGNLERARASAGRGRAERRRDHRIERLSPPPACGRAGSAPTSTEYSQALRDAGFDGFACCLFPAAGRSPAGDGRSSGPRAVGQSSSSRSSSR
jgi:hypothetical protein